jgi:serine/threonine-protein kinase
MLVDFDDVFIEHALKNGYVSAEQVAECRRLQKKEAESNRRYYVGQILIRRRYLSCADFLTIENALGHKLYECMGCKARYGISELNDAGTLTCRGCGAEVKVDAANLSIVEILASRDPRDLTISLCPTGTKSATPAPAKLQTSTRLTAAGNTPAGNGAMAATPGPTGAAAGAAVGATDSKRSKSRLNRSVLELSKDELSGLARYEVLEELGRGGMGIVFKARQIDIDRICALKVIKAGPSVPEVQINRFVQEARAAAQLNHPHIVTVYDFGRYRDMFYIAMEFIPGSALAKLIYEGTGLPILRAIEITDDILDAINYAHTKGVIHRDLKPQNIIIETDRGRGRLIDFGLAKDHSASLGLTQTGQILGSPFYLSPEQTRGESRNVDPRSDVFAMGVILYEMLTKTRPFSGKSAAEVYAKILKERPAPPSAIEPDVEQELQAIVLKALEKEPKDRYQTAEAFQRALRDYKERYKPRDPSGSAKIRSGTQKAVTSRISQLNSSQRNALQKRQSDRPPAVRGRTSGQIPIQSLDGGGKGSSKLVFVLVGALALAGIGLVALQPNHPPPEDHPAIAVPTTATTTTPPVTPVDPGGPDLPRDAEQEALRDAERFERGNAGLWADLEAQWKQLGDRYPGQASHARERRLAAEKGAKDESDQLLAKASALATKVDRLGEAAKLLLEAAPRFEGTPWLEPLRARAKDAETQAQAFAKDAIAASEKKLQAGKLEEALVPVTSPGRTGFPEVDALLQAQREKIDAAEKQANDAAAAAVAAAEAGVLKKIETARGFKKERRYADAVATLDSVLASGLSELNRHQVATLRSEAALLETVLAGAGKAEIEKAKRDVEIDVTRTQRGCRVVRVNESSVTVRVPNGGGESDYKLVELPPRSLVRLFDLSPAGAAPEAPLARAVFYLNENEGDLARAAFDEARKRGLDVSPWEARLSLLPAGAPLKAEGPPQPPATTGNPATKPPGDEKAPKDDGAAIVMAGGTFTMGSGGDQQAFVPGDERMNAWPAHSVTVDAYALDKYEVSNAQYAKFLDYIAKHKTTAHKFCSPEEPAGKDHTPSLWKSAVFGGDAHPVVGVDWWDAFAYARFAGKRLPTEAEWEHAAHGPDDRGYPWGNTWDPKRCVSSEYWLKEDPQGDAAWERFKDLVEHATQLTLPVDALPEGKTASGISNMAGNVSEWVADFYAPYSNLVTGAERNPQGPKTGSERIVRGGSWYDRDPERFTATARRGLSPQFRDRWLGFRCARDADDKGGR